MKNVLVLVSSLALGVSVLSFADTREEKIAEVKKIYAELPPVPSVSKDGLQDYYARTLNDLRNSFEAVIRADEEKRDQSIALARLEGSVDFVKVLRAQADLYKAIHQELVTLGPKIEKWALPTYVDKRGLTVIPPDSFARLELAFQFSTSTLQLDSMLNFDHILNNPTTFHSLDSFGWHSISRKITDRGLLEMTSGSHRLGEFLHAFPRELWGNLNTYFDNLCNLSQKAIAPDAKTRGKDVLSEVEELHEQGRRVRWEADYSHRVLSGTLGKLESIRTAKGADLEKIEEAVIQLGKGAHSVLTSARQMYEHLTTGQKGRPEVPPPGSGGTMLTSVDRDIYELLGRSEGGGQHFNQYSQPKHHASYLPLYERLMFFKYLLVAGAAISRIESTSEGKASLGDRMLTGLRYGVARLTGGNATPKEPETSKQTENRALTVISDRPKSSSRELRPADFVPEPLKRRRSELEDHLWKVFFENARIGEAERIGCDFKKLNAP